MQGSLTEAGEKKARSRDFRDVGGLRSLLSFSDFEFDLVALLQALITFRSDRAVVNKDIRPISAPDKPVAFGVIEPLNRSFQTFHLQPLFPHVLLGGQGRTRSPVGCILER